MDKKNKYYKIKMNIDISKFKKLDDERTIAFIILVIAVYLFLGSYSYSLEAGMWPRYISIAAIFGSILVLVQNHLPKSVQILVKEDYQAVERDKELSEQAESQDHNTEIEFDAKHALFTTVSILSFGIIVLIFGYVVATILFIAAYNIYFDLNPKYSIATIGVTLLILYLVGPPLNIPIFEGLTDILPRVKL